MLEKKQNVFDDFQAATRWLIENKYAKKDCIAIRGGSNGGREFSGKLILFTQE
jgi:prolyl oligopeptidase